MTADLATRDPNAIASEVSRDQMPEPPKRDGGSAYAATPQDERGGCHYALALTRKRRRSA